MGALFGEQDGRALLCELSAIAPFRPQVRRTLFPRFVKSTARAVSNSSWTPASSNHGAVTVLVVQQRIRPPPFCSILLAGPDQAVPPQQGAIEVFRAAVANRLARSTVVCIPSMAHGGPMANLFSHQCAF